MKKFFYRAKNTNNLIISDYILAADISDAAVKLQHKNLIILEIKDMSPEKNDISVSYDKKNINLTITEKKQFFNSFYFLFKSGLSVIEIFQSIYQSSTNKKIKQICHNILKKIEKGRSLSESVSEMKNAFGLAYTKLIVAGDESGKLESVLSDIIKNLAREEEIKSNVINSLTYPTLIFCLAIAVGLFFKFFVFEVFSYAGVGICSAKILQIAISAIVKILMIFIIIFGVTCFIYLNKSAQKFLLNFVFNMQICKKLLKNYYFTNFFSVFAIAYSAGVPLNETIVLANSVVNIPEANKKIRQSEKMLNNGCELTTALSVTGLFNNYAISQVSAGEKAGELDKTLKIVSADYETRLNNTLSVLLKLVEPMMIAIVGLFVAYIAYSAYKGYYGAIFSMI